MQGEVDSVGKATHDLTLVPVQIKWPLRIGFKDYIKSPYGSMSQVAIEKYEHHPDAPADTFPGFEAKI